ncbi:hypothetical protein ACQP1W_49170 [Spirillospora sp. CA-255316]
MADGRSITDPLARLAAFLGGQGLKTEVTERGLKVVNPEITGCCSANAADMVTCRPRPEDFGRLWFWTSWGEPIAEAGHIVDAALIIRGNLARRALGEVAR